MRSFRLLALSLVLAAAAPHALAQPFSTPVAASRADVASAAHPFSVSLTVFRNPATGVEVRYGPLAAHAGYYPTIIPRNGENRNTEFVRLGAAAFLRERGISPYLAASYLVSLTDGWADSVLLEGGALAPVYRGIGIRLGAAVLVPTDGERVRLNPTIGASLRLF